MTDTPVVTDTPQPHRRKWAVLVYQAADNNLTEECIYALTEMKAATNTVSRALARPLDVIVRLDPLGRGNPSRLFNLKTGRSLEDDEDERQRRFEIDTGNPETLLDFLCTAIDKNDADHFMLVLSGHGAATSEGFFLKDEERPLLSIPSSFPVPALRRVFQSDRLKDALGDRKIDILGFDACMMSVGEVCYQLRDLEVLNLVVGSEGFSLNSGWPLRSILEHMRGFQLNPDQLAEFIVKAYVEFYGDYHLGGLSVDQAAVDLSQICHLRDEVDRLAQSMIYEIRRESGDHDDNLYYREGGKPFQDALLLAHWAAQSYNGEQCVDLYDFCDLLEERVPHHESDESVWKCCRRIKNFLTQGPDKLIRKCCYVGAAFQFSHGLSIYFPWAYYDLAPSYRELDFAKHSKWREFLKIYLKATRRRPREGKDIHVTEKAFRSTPPSSKGPSGKVFSMRNPPTRFHRPKCAGPEKPKPENDMPSADDSVAKRIEGVG